MGIDDIKKLNSPNLKLVYLYILYLKQLKRSLNCIDIENQEENLFIKAHRSNISTKNPILMSKISLRDISTDLGIDKSNISRYLRILEKKSFINVSKSRKLEVEI